MQKKILLDTSDCIFFSTFSICKSHPYVKWRAIFFPIKYIMEYLSVRQVTLLQIFLEQGHYILHEILHTFYNIDFVKGSWSKSRKHGTHSKLSSKTHGPWYSVLSLQHHLPQPILTWWSLRCRNPKVSIISIFFLLLPLYKKKVHLLTTIKDLHASPPWLAFGKKKQNQAMDFLVYFTLF